MYDDSSNHSNSSRLADGVTGPVIVPLFQAGVTGILIALCAVSLVHYLAPGTALFPPFLLVWTGSTLVSWLAYRARWQYVIERVLGVDLNNDGYIGAPSIQVAPYAEPPVITPQVMRVILDQEHVTDFIDLPYPEKIPQLASGLLEGRTFKAETFNHLFHRSEFERVRDEMIRRGLATWKNERAHAQGVELTAAGRAVMRKVAEDRHTPALPPRG